MCDAEGAKVGDTGTGDGTTPEDGKPKNGGVEETKGTKRGGRKGNPMRYPYTFTAKLVQFPYRFYFENGPAYRYFMIAVFACIPVFAFIQYKANSPANVQKWEEIRRKEIEEYEKRWE